MLENARRQAILVLLTMIAGIAICLLMKPAYGIDLKGGIQLIYMVPDEVVERVLKTDPTATTDKIMEQTVSIIQERVDPSGVIDALVSRHGKTGILIELPNLADVDLQAAEERIESLGKLEMRMVARDDYAGIGKDGKEVKFSLRDEKVRLNKWLAGGGKEALKENWKNIENFNALPPDQGGPLATSDNLQWVVHFVEPSLKDPGATRWSYSMAKSTGDTNLANSVVAVYDEADYAGGMVPDKFKNLPKEQKEQKRLIELVAINFNEKHFTGADLEPSGVKASIDPTTGDPAVAYSVVGDKSVDYSDWSARNIQKHSAIILNNVIKSAPVFISRIPGNGQITGGFSQPEVEELVKVLRTGSLKVEPERQSVQIIGPTLGDHAVHMGSISLVAGCAAVFAFMLWYYRLSGLVACITLMLNLFLLWSAVVFMQATITLPGLGGIVLTMGMAVDANVLIYERIREETNKGKDLLRATRTGFERAMVVILDSNTTTFLSGLVLYNVGVGPVRGFAVTLMVGILTTVFTQFFVTRLLFHYLIEWKYLTQYRMRTIFKDFNVDFVRYIKIALILSTAINLFGLVYWFFVPREVKLGLDFTGGANLQMVLREPTTAADLRARLEKDVEFNKVFFNPSVNTVGKPDDEGRATTFNLRIKLTDELRTKIEGDRQSWRLSREAAQKAGQQLPPVYEPPYLIQLRRIFAESLVAPAFSNAATEPLPNSSSKQALIDLHFQQPVPIATVKEVLTKSQPGSVQVLPATGAPDQTETKDVRVVWTVGPNVTEGGLFSIVRDALKGKGLEKRATDAEVAQASLFKLSDPFPAAEEIEGRMVGELRNAAIAALILSWVLIGLYLRIRFHEYKFGIAAVVSLVHDVLVTFAVVLVANQLGLVHAEINLNMIACFLTIIGYSVNDTIVVFDRIRENANENLRIGHKETYKELINRSINQTLSRTVLTSGVTMFCVLAQFLVNFGSDSDLESFAFGMVIGIITGTYSSIYIAAPILILMHQHDEAHSGGDGGATPVPVPAQSVS